MRETNRREEERQKMDNKGMIRVGLHGFIGRRVNGSFCFVRGTVRLSLLILVVYLILT